MPRISPGARGITVLLIAGESRLCGAVVSALAESELHGPGFTLIEASSLAIARSALEADSPDAVVIHASLPDGSLADLMGSIRSRRFAPPVFVVSSTAAETDALEAARAGATGFLSLSDGSLTRLPSLILSALHLARSATSPAADPGHITSLRAALAATTHDLRGALTGLTALLSLLANGADGLLAPAQVRRVARIKTSADRMSAILQEMGELALIESGRATPRLVPVDLPAIAGLVCDDLAPMARSRLLELHIRTEPGVHPVEGDPHRLPRLFRLLMSAALQTAEGPTVELSLAPAELGVNVSLREIRRPLPMEAMVGLQKLSAEFRLEGDLPGDEAQALADPISQDLARALAEAIIRAHGGRILTGASESAESIVSFFLPSHHATEIPVADRPRDHHAHA